MKKKSTIKRKRIKFCANYHVFYNVGGCLGSSVEAPTRKELLNKMKYIRRDNREKAEVVTFEPIKKMIEIQEARGKFTVFRRVTNPYIDRRRLIRFYNEV